MTKILVACVDYPTHDNRSLQYVHARNKEYLKAGMHVEVLNFSIEKDYVYEGIIVRSLNAVKKDINTYHKYVLVCHAPNIRNHYKFVKAYGTFFRGIVFIFHGHEIVEQLKVYPKPYEFKKELLVKRVVISIYDKFKIRIWKRYFHDTNKTSKLVFVSDFLLKEFQQNMKFKQNDLMNRAVVINNGVGSVFEKKKYDSNCKKKYDYITIRSDIDSSVYCIDLLCKIAMKNSDKKFLLIGKGDFFKYNQCPNNLSHINRSMPQKELLSYINSSRTALMPTRRDSQGVMSCELATFGINLITSNLEVCHEMFDLFDNVIMLSDSEMMNSLSENTVFHKCTNINKKFYACNTAQKEIELLRSEF